VVQRSARGDQLPRDVVVTQVRSGNQPRAVVAAGDEPGVGPELEQHTQRRLASATAAIVTAQ
jgi:hypothetical protein